MEALAEAKAHRYLPRLLRSTPFSRRLGPRQPLSLTLLRTSRSRGPVVPSAAPEHTLLSSIPLVAGFGIMSSSVVIPHKRLSSLVTEHPPSNNNTVSQPSHSRSWDEVFWIPGLDASATWVASIFSACIDSFRKDLVLFISQKLKMSTPFIDFNFLYIL